MATKLQKAAIKKKVAMTMESGGKEPKIAKVMRAAGYSDRTARTPKKLTESKGWEELLEEYLPDDYLMKGLQEGTKANKQLALNPIFKKDAPTSQSAHELPQSKGGNFIEVPDFAVRHKYFETSLKIKGKLIEKRDITSDGEKLEGIQVMIVEDKSAADE